MITSEEIADILCIFDATALGYHWSVAHCVPVIQGQQEKLILQYKRKKSCM